MKASIKIAILAFCILLGWAGWRSLNALLNRSSLPVAQATKGEKGMSKKISKSEQEWKKTLTPEQYKVMIQCGTERPFTGKYNDFWQKGTYFCAACGTPLFSSETKYEHGTGWPSFMAALKEANLEYRDDFSLGVKRTEVRCATCGAHLGHVFDDGPGPSYRHYCINSAALDFKPAAAEKSAEKSQPETATFAAGCFWGVEDKFGQVKGVLSTVVGYTGGITKNPTYRDVCTDDTGHAESVQVTYDPSQTSYEELVRQFFSFHDPTQLNRQGPDVGTQYRSAVFYHNEEQKRIAEKVRAEIEKSGEFRKKIVTEIVPASKFYEAEEYHQKYYEKNKIKSCDY
jgi:peptide methionine sulfoxide reductase msrA/msrB